MVTISWKYDYHFPIYYTLAKVLYSVFATPYALRFISCLLGVGSIVVFSQIVRTYVFRSNLYAGSFVILFLSLNRILHFIGYFGRPYTLLLFSYLLTVYFFLGLLRNSTQKDILGFSLSGLLLIFSHFYGIIYLISFLGVFFIMRKLNLISSIGTLSSRLKYFVWAVIGIASSLFMYKLYFSMVHPDGIAWIEPFSIGLLNFSIKRLFGSPLLYYFVVFSIGVYLGILLWNKTFQRHKETIYFVGLIGIPVLLVSIVSLAVSIIDSRYLSPLVVPITLLFGLSLIHILKRRQLILSLVFILLLVAEGVIILTTPTLFYDINWYKVEDKITTQLVDNPSIDTIVYAPRNMNLVLGYYLSDAADSLSREINLVGFNALESIQKYDFNLNKTRSLMYVDTTYGSEKLQDDILSHLRTTYDEYAVTSIGRVNIYLFRSE